jgi:hypothetical protein
MMTMTYMSFHGVFIMTVVSLRHDLGGWFGLPTPQLTNEKLCTGNHLSSVFEEGPKTQFTIG